MYRYFRLAQQLISELARAGQEGIQPGVIKVLIRYQGSEQDDLGPPAIVEFA